MDLEVKRAVANWIDCQVQADVERHQYVAAAYAKPQAYRRELGTKGR